MSRYNKIGIIAAMDIEIDTLKEKLESCEIKEMTGSTYYSGRIGNHEVILLKCGIGKVSAAIGTQTMIDYYHPDAIINTGCAGGLDKNIKVGDTVLSASSVEWDMDTTPLGDPRGFISGLNKVFLEADKTLVSELKDVIEKVSAVKVGLVVSGDQFICKDEQRDMILGAFPDALCAEMEGGAIGHTCVQNNVPYCVIRSMSDTADGNSTMSYPEFAKMAGEKSADYLYQFLTE